MTNFDINSDDKLIINHQIENKHSFLKIIHSWAKSRRIPVISLTLTTMAIGAAGDCFFN